MPFICMLAPPKLVGHVPWPEALALVPDGARLLPKTTPTLPAVTGAEKLAPFTIPPELTLGAWAANEREQESTRIERGVRIARVV